MKNLLAIARLDFLGRQTSLALLVLRLWVGLSMMILHGWPKLRDFSENVRGFPDPLGVGRHASLTLAIFGELVCSILLVLGLFGRLAALGTAVTMAVAFFLFHGAALSGEMSGEQAFIYLAAYVALIIAGPGRFSLDARLAGRRTRNEYS